MKIFKIIGDGNYSQGMALVLAESSKQAADLANEAGSRTWNIHYKSAAAITMQAIESKLKTPQVLLLHEFGE